MKKSLAVAFLVTACALAQSQVNILTSSLPSGTVGTAYSFTLSASGGTSPYTWSAGGSLPPGLTLTSNGSLQGTPTTAGNYAFTIAVVDARGASASRGFTLNVGTSGTTQKPSITTPSPLPTATVGQPYSQTLSASGGAGSYQWTLAQGSQLPTGLTLSSSGVISGTPTKVGSSTFQVQVTDSAQQSDTKSFTLTVNSAPLTITTVPPLFTGTVGAPYAQTFSAAGGTGSGYAWSILSGNPGGLTLDPASGILQGTPQTAGTFSFTVQVADSAGAKTSQTFSLTVNPPALTITVAGQPASGTVGVAYNQKLPVTANGGTAPITWSLASGSVPGLVFDPVALTMSGTPTTAATFTFTLQAADAAGLTATRQLAITIAPPGLTLTTPRQLPSVALNGVYSQTIAATGGTPPYTWSATGLPAGLTINASTGAIGGTASAAGSFSPVITVQDAALTVVKDLFTINVTLPPPPSVTLSGLQGTIPARQQFPLQLSIDAPYPVEIKGTALLTFSPDSGLPDRTVVFASGLTSLNFTIPAGSTTPAFDSPFMLQTGTVAGTINVSVTLNAGSADITPSPAPALTGQVQRSAPVITDVQVTRGSGSIALAITGYVTSREVTQAVFNFSAAAGQSLQTSASSITVDVGSTFSNWYQSATNTQYGSQFVFTQPFTVQGDPTAVIPVSVTFTNRDGSTTFTIKP